MKRRSGGDAAAEDRSLLPALKAPLGNDMLILSLPLTHRRRGSSGAESALSLVQFR